MKVGNRPARTLAFSAITSKVLSRLSSTLTFSNISPKSHLVSFNLEGGCAYRPEWSVDFGEYAMTFEKEYEDVLQNLEFAITQVYRERPDLIDAEVLMAIESLIRIYSAQAQGKSISSRPQRCLSQQVAESVRQICEWRLGQVPLTDAEGNPAPAAPIPKTPNEIVDCLKRIQSSIRLWTKKGGRQGYLNFVSEFLP